MTSVIAFVVNFFLFYIFSFAFSEISNVDNDESYTTTTVQVLLVPPYIPLWRIEAFVSPSHSLTILFANAHKHSVSPALSSSLLWSISKTKDFQLKPLDDFARSLWISLTDPLSCQRYRCDRWMVLIMSLNYGTIRSYSVQKNKIITNLTQICVRKSANLTDRTSWRIFLLRCKYDHYT